MAISLISATVLAAIAGAGTIDAKSLVLPPRQVPDGFEIDRANSRYWSNAAYVRGRPQVRAIVAKSHRLSGYYATYETHGGGTRTIVSGVDVCATASGADALLGWTDRQLRAANAVRKKQGQAWPGGRRVDIGKSGWVHWSGEPSKYVAVIWRDGRVFASLHTWGMSVPETLKLARVQQGRIATALR